MVNWRGFDRKESYPIWSTYCPILALRKQEKQRKMSDRLGGILTENRIDWALNNLYLYSGLMFISVEVSSIMIHWFSQKFGPPRFLILIHCHVTEWLETRFLLVTGFIGQLQVLSLCKHSVIANSHTLQFTRTGTISSQSTASSPVVAW
jgi:hypothetical protein